MTTVDGRVAAAGAVGAATLGAGGSSLRDDPPIESVTCEVYRVPTDRPEADGTFAWDATTVVVTRVRAGGQEGLGYTYGPAACASLADDMLAPAVVGDGALDVTARFEAMVRAVRNAGRPGVASMAIAAVDTALWDLKGRLLGVAVASLIGQARPTVPIYGSGGFTTYSDAELTEQLGGWVADGIPRVKLKIGSDWGAAPGRDLDRVAVARRAVGPDAELYVDANGAYDQKQAVRLARRFEDLGVSWFEEPVSSDDLVGLRTVREQTTIDVAAGEYGFDLPYFERMVGARAVDCLQCDVTRCGGFTEWRRVAALAAASGLEISGHCAPALHLAVAPTVPNLRHLEWFHDHVRIERMLFDGAPVPDHGSICPDLSRPGLGLDLKAADAARFRQS